MALINQRQLIPWKIPTNEIYMFNSSGEFIEEKNFKIWSTTLTINFLLRLYFILVLQHCSLEQRNLVDAL